MFLRKITQEKAYPRPPAEAFEDARQALLRIGKVKSADEAAGVLTGSVPGGGWVTLHITVLQAESGSRLALEARCDDVWGAGARRGINQFLQALPDHGAGAGAAVPARSIAQTTRSLEDSLTIAQKISVGVFFALTSLCSLDVAWGRGLFPLSLEWLYALAAAGGAVTGLIVVQPRYRIVGMVSGAVTGLCAVGFSVLVFRQLTMVFKLVAVVTTLIGCLPGLILFQGLRLLQDRLFPPRNAVN